MIQLKTKDIRIAVQSKGRLKTDSIEFLISIGFDIDESDRALLSSCNKYEADVIYLRDDDIPQYVASGVADFGIVGENVYYESPSGARIVKKLGFSKCSLVVAIPNDSDIKEVSDLEGRKIATSYPNLLKAYLNKAEVKAEVVLVKGSAEVAPVLGFADAICDLVQSGKTLKENGLKPAFKIMESQAILIESPFLKDFEFNPFQNESN